MGNVTLSADWSTYQEASKPAWWAIDNTWNNGTLVNGVNYTQTITADPSTFPNGTVISWNWGDNTNPSNVWGYPEVVYGEQAGTWQSPDGQDPTPVEINNLTTVTGSFNLSLSGSTNETDVLWETHLTSAPDSGSSLEFGIMLHSPTYVTQWIDGCTDKYSYNENGLSATIAVFGGSTPSYVVVAPTQGDLLSGTVDIGSILKYLVAQGVVSGSYYLDGFELGAEPQQGSGTLTINSLGYNWNGTVVGDVSGAGSSGSGSGSGSSGGGSSGAGSSGGGSSSGGSSGGGPGSGSSFTPSPNDAVIKAGSGGSITDANGNIWTITSSDTLNENGSAAGYTANVAETAYVNGSVWQENTSGNWYEWNGGGWNGGSDPLPAGSSGGGGSGSTPSAKDTVVQAGSNGSITDGSGNVWTITSSDTVDENGSGAGYTANVTEIAYVNNNVWQENTAGDWYESNGSGGWNQGSDPLPASGGSSASGGDGSSSGSGSGGSTSRPSADDTVIQAGSGGSITDGDGNVWTIDNSGSIDVNGTPAGYSANAVELAYVNGNVWQENSSNLWWEWQNNTWQPGAGTSQSPLPAGATPITAVNAADTPAGSGMSFIYNTGSAETAPAPSSSSPIIYEVDSGGTGLLTISDFRVGTDSLALGAGVTITSQTFGAGVIDLHLSNQGQVLLHHS